MCVCVCVFDLGGLSVDRYVRALAVCSSLAELASNGSEAEFSDRVGTLLSLQKHWACGRSGAKVVAGDSGGAEDSQDGARLAVEIDSVSMESILSSDRVTKSQPVLVLCHKTNAATRDESARPQTERYDVFPAQLTVPSTGAGKCPVVISSTHLSLYLLLLLLLLLYRLNPAFFQDTWVSRYWKGKTSLDLNEARDDGGFCMTVASAGPYANYLHLAVDR